MGKGRWLMNIYESLIAKALNGDSGGGGGGDDFSTAEVTLIATTDTFFHTVMPVMDAYTGYMTARLIEMYSDEEDNTFTVPLYQGAVVIIPYAPEADISIVSIEGSAVWNDEIGLIILGNCIITITGQPVT